MSGGLTDRDREKLSNLASSEDEEYTVLACPECDTVSMNSRLHKRPKWRCENGHEFDEPVERPRRAPGGEHERR